MKDERRAAERYSIHQLIDISADGVVSITATGLDLSTGGLSCVADRPLEPMSPVFITLGLPFVSGDHLVKCGGFVARAQMSGGKCIAGIQFTDLPEEYKSMVEEYLAAIGSEAR